MFSRYENVGMGRYPPTRPTHDILDLKESQGLFMTHNETTRGGRRYLLYVFTENGDLMASSVLRSSKAKMVAIELVRTFTLMRDHIAQKAD